MKAHREWFPYFEAWGNGYAAFTYSVKERPTVIEYIKNQKVHHAKMSFREEYEALLVEFGIDPSKDLFLRDGGRYWPPARAPPHHLIPLLPLTI